MRGGEGEGERERDECVSMYVCMYKRTRMTETGRYGRTRMNKTREGYLSEGPAEDVTASSFSPPPPTRQRKQRAWLEADRLSEAAAVQIEETEGS